MKLSTLEQQIADEHAPNAPQVILWMPPSGSAVECPDIETAQNAAARFAARHPGHTVAVYELVGWARAPIREPEFIPAGQELLSAIDIEPQAGEEILEPKFTRPDPVQTFLAKGNEYNE